MGAKGAQLHFAQMGSVDPTGNDTSSYANLASFYEKYPYPVPVEDLSGYIAVWSSTARRRSEYHLLFPDQTFREDLDILIAGCGTSQAARHAVRWPSARVLGIDVSESSLRHTDELKRRHGLTNLETLKLAIEDVGQLDRQFDLIICTGVIHHLRSPEAALHSLRHCLRPAGALQLMVYAHHGRVGVSMMQEYIRILGVDVAETPMQKARGLEVKNSLDVTSGMLFPFEKPEETAKLLNEYITK